MINRIFAFLFFLKKDKKQSDNSVPKYIRITIDGQRADISTKRCVNPGHWNQKFQKMEGSTEDFRSVNAYLKPLEHQVFTAHRQLIDAGKTITVDSLKNRITG
jgi:Arm DNA-binding domain